MVMVVKISKVIGDDGLMAVMVVWCWCWWWRHQGQACVAKVCAQRVHEAEYCSSTDMQQQR